MNTKACKPDDNVRRYVGSVLSRVFADQDIAELPVIVREFQQQCGEADVSSSVVERVLRDYSRNSGSPPRVRELFGGIWTYRRHVDHSYGETQDRRG